MISAYPVQMRGEHWECGHISTDLVIHLVAKPKADHADDFGAIVDNSALCGRTPGGRQLWRQAGRGYVCPDCSEVAVAARGKSNAQTLGVRK